MLLIITKYRIKKAGLLLKGKGNPFCTETKTAKFPFYPQPKAAAIISQSS